MTELDVLVRCLHENCRIYRVYAAKIPNCLYRCAPRPFDNGDEIDNRGNGKFYDLVT